MGYWDYYRGPPGSVVVTRALGGALRGLGFEGFRGLGSLGFWGFRALGF